MMSMNMPRSALRSSSTLLLPVAAKHSKDLVCNAKGERVREEEPGREVSEVTKKIFINHH